jgi:hypothetical protein
VWISRVAILAGQDNSTGFKVVHFTLAGISIAFGIAVGWIGIRALRLRSVGNETHAQLTEETATGA